MANSSTIPFYGIEGPPNANALVRIRVRNPDGSTNTEFPANEETNAGTGLGNGTFSTVQTLTLADAVTGLPYTWEARQVTAQTSAAFDSPVAILAPKQFLGWVKNGAILTDPNLDALVSGVFSTSGTSGQIVSNGVPTSLYIDWNEFVNDFGMNNIVLASNKEQSMQTPTGSQPIQKGQPNFYAVQNAFNYATDRIHNILQGGVLKIPLDFTPNGGVVPERVKNWAKVIAFCRLQRMRTPTFVGATPYRRGGYVGHDAPYASALEEAVMDCAAHKYGQWAQMPEAVHAVGADPGYVCNTHVYGFVRYMDGHWNFGWIDSAQVPTIY